MNNIVQVTNKDRVAVAKGILELNAIQHIRYMSRAMLANTSGIKDTKLRATLQTMVDEGLVSQYQITENKRLQRYYYTLTAEGYLFLREQAAKPTECGSWCDCYDPDQGCTMPAPDREYACPLIAAEDA